MLSAELYQTVNRYVERHIKLEELEDWLAARFTKFFRFPYSSDTDFVAEIELALAEMSDGMLTEEEFRSLVSDLLKRQQVVWASYPPEREVTYAESSNQPSLTLWYVPSHLAYTPA